MAECRARAKAENDPGATVGHEAELWLMADALRFAGRSWAGPRCTTGNRPCRERKETGRVSIRPVLVRRPDRRR
jgi:hypothetical protein